MLAAARRGRLLSAESAAGWIFADLLLVLFIVGLGSAIKYTPPPPPEPEPKIPPIVGMKTDPTALTVAVNGELLSTGTTLPAKAKDAVCDAIRSRTRSLRGERAALVLVFGGAGDVTSGQNVARAVAGQLGCADDEIFRGKVPTRAFWDGSLPLGQARLEIFLFLREGDRS